MRDAGKLKAEIEGGAFDGAFTSLYPDHEGGVGACRARYLSLLETFEHSFGTRYDGDVRLFSAPGRIEIGGNHTDHQRGVVLAAAIDMDVICAAARRDGAITIRSEGYPGISVLPGDLSKREEERGTPSAMVRGVARWFRDHGFTVGGFDAVIASDVATGSGLSSSAAFEVIVGVILNALYNPVDGAGGADIAKAGKYAENEYFGKPSGLMDQAASSIGGLMSIDFFDPDAPSVRRVASPLADAGYRICVVDTKGSHSDLTGEYAAIPEEMLCIAGSMDKSALRDVDEDLFFSRIPQLRSRCGDRAVLRALHFFKDDRIAAREADALDAGDIRGFLDLVIRSGRSSLSRLQNIYAASDPRSQGISLALALSEDMLEETGGAWRVHGGGFAGTILAFVPERELPHYAKVMDGVFGEGSCRVLSIRPVGGTELKGGRCVSTPVREKPPRPRRRAGGQA
jgi:galactokinase